jgi:hypothetical protein
MDGKPKRRWLRFSIRTLLAVVTIFCVWLGWNFYELRQRHLIKQFLTAQGIALDYGEPTAPWNSFPLSWRLLGEEPVSFIKLHRGKFSAQDVEQIARWFPESRLPVRRE